MKLYLAGALFNEGEISQRLKEGRLLKERFGEKLSVLIQLNNRLMKINKLYLLHKKFFVETQKLYITVIYF